MDDAIEVQRRADASFDVRVRQGGSLSHHVVTVPSALAAHLGHPDADPERLVALSFAFLLEREPASSILRHFALDVIERYFPEYRQEMGRRLA